MEVESWTILGVHCCLLSWRL
ncbi:hypothetical protein LINPERPRIM_LOCUS31001 [Linum perenne]